jgi:phosphoribosylaminoimidazolecarboxamide formyltransferase/IMP cyclohydrolase
MTKIKRALISVYDKVGIVKFARELNELGIEIVATSGTLKILKEEGIQLVKHISDVTKFPEILDGRIKTEHPNLIAGILALRNKKEHMDELNRLGIEPIDMVVCDLYPIEKMSKEEEKVDLNIFLKNIDIGGPNLIRAAAKNFENVVVIVNPNKYDQVLEELKREDKISIKTRYVLAKEAFKKTAQYDLIIHKLFNKCKLEQTKPKALRT